MVGNECACAFVILLPGTCHLASGGKAQTRPLLCLPQSNTHPVRSHFPDPRRIRAAHCLTSVQFSPTGGHLLLAYGKKHLSLLRSLVAERGVVIPMHTILEVFRCG